MEISKTWTHECEDMLFAKELAYFFPSIPKKDREDIMEVFRNKRHRVSSGHVSRSVPLVQAHIRHTYTQYDYIINETKDRSYAHAVVKARCEKHMRSWGWLSKRRLDPSKRNKWKGEILTQYKERNHGQSEN